MKKIWALIKRTFAEWSEDKAARLAAALSYYTIFSIPPLLVIVIAIAGIVFGQDQVRTSILGQMEGLVGPEAAAGIQTMLESAQRPGAGLVATVIGIVVLLLGASGVFGQLQDSLNTIWNVKPKPGLGIMGMLRKRFFSFSMVLGVGFLLLVSLVVTTVLAALGEYLLGLLPAFEFLIQVINFVASFAIITVLFALTFKFVPDARIAWKDVWLGAAVTSLLFTLGKMAIGIYLGNSSVGSAFGAAASVVIILVWVYYSAQILFLGAEFTQVYANMFGSKVVPDEDALPLSEKDRAEQGIPSRNAQAVPAPEAANPAGPALPIPAAIRSANRSLPAPAPQPGIQRILAAGAPALLAFGVAIVGSLVMVLGEKKLPPRDGGKSS